MTQLFDSSKMCCTRRTFLYDIVYYPVVINPSSDEISMLLKVLRKIHWKAASALICRCSVMSEAVDIMNVL